MLFDSIRHLGMRALRSLGPETILIVAAFHVPLTYLFVVVLVKSMGWETTIDTPMFMYSGFLMDKLGMAPVRDFFTYNMPGTHVIFRWLYHFFGSSIIGMRLADTFVLAIILALFARILKPFGTRVVWAGVVIFGILHVTLGTHTYLQRDYLALVPLQLAILSTTTWFSDRERLRWFMTGLFTGMLATIKPHLMVGGLVLYIYLIFETQTKTGANRRDWVRRGLWTAVWCILGGVIPMLWMAAYLAYYGVLAEFVTVLTQYFPLHADISGGHIVFESGEKLRYRIVSVFGKYAWDYFQLAVGVTGGITLFLSNTSLPAKQRRHGNLLLALGAVYFLYPAIAARFYDHHYYPFRLLSAVWIAFCLRKWNSEAALRVKACALCLAAFTIVAVFYVNFWSLQIVPAKMDPYYRTERLANWLRQRMEPDDTAQAIEWAFCGSTHALLLNEAKPATHTIWGEVFFHHVSDPFVQKLKRNFIQQLSESQPRFIIQTKVDMDFVDGRDCMRLFPEFEAILQRDYFIALESDSFRVWESNESPTAEKDREQFEKLLDERGGSWDDADDRFDR